MEDTKDKGNSATDTLSVLLYQIKKLWILVILLVVLLVGTNMAWLYVFQSYDYVSQDGNGHNYYNRSVGGSVYNGTESKDEEERQIEGN